MKRVLLTQNESLMNKLFFLFFYDRSVAAHILIALYSRVIRDMHCLYLSYLFEVFFYPSIPLGNQVCLGSRPDYWFLWYKIKAKSFDVSVNNEVPSFISRKCARTMSKHEVHKVNDEWFLWRSTHFLRNAARTLFDPRSRSLISSLF